MRRFLFGTVLLALVASAGCRLGSPGMPRPQVEIIRTSDKMPSEVDPLLHVTLPPLDAGDAAPDAEAMVTGDVHSSTRERFDATPILDGGSRDASPAPPDHSAH